MLMRDTALMAATVVWCGARETVIAAGSDITFTVHRSVPHANISASSRLIVDLGLEVTPHDLRHRSGVRRLDVAAVRVVGDLVCGTADLLAAAQAPDLSEKT
jgi:hypothetical protein